MTPDRTPDHALPHMTIAEALARMAARWTHPPIDRRDVEERVAIRLEGELDPITVAIQSDHVVHLFVQIDPATTGRRARWTNRYIHELRDVDALLHWTAAHA